MIARPLWLVLAMRLLVSGAGTSVYSADPVPPAAPPVLPPESTFVPPDPGEKPEAALNVPLGTLGGTQFWTDLVIRRGWRIQRHTVTGHYRLLDADDTRQGWGNYAYCLQELDRLLPKDHAVAPQPHVVVLLHGLGCTRGRLTTMATRLEQEGYRVVSFGYASTRGTIGDHAAALHHVLRHLEPSEKISFVGHSLGNLVVRHYLKEHPELRPEEPRRDRMVMLGPPNLGSQMARRFKNSGVFQLITGPAGTQLSEQWNDAAKNLATPAFEFGIVAGDPDHPIPNPLVGGDNDFVVSVDETRLPGATDFRCVEVSHMFLPTNDSVIDLTVRFLRSGCFETPERREPILPGRGRLDP